MLQIITEHVDQKAPIPEIPIEASSISSTTADDSKSDISQITAVATEKTEEEVKAEQAVKLEEGRKKLEEYYKVVQDKLKENIDKVRLPTRENEVSSIANVFDEKKTIDLGSVKLVKCVDFIGLSDFNPVPVNRRSRGDLLYIKMRTLEG